MGLILSILIFAGFIWVIRKSLEDPENSKENLLAQIEKIQKRVTILENEVQRLKGLPAIPDSTLKHEPVSGHRIQENFEHSALSHTEKISENKPKNALPIRSEKSYKDSDSSINKVIENKIAKETPKKIDFESLITGNVMNKVGVLALILGMGFFLNYTFVQTWISPIIKILTSTFTAIIFLFGASWFNKTETYKVFVQGIAGAGIAILYLSVFAAYSFYNLINYPVAVILMLTIATIAFSQALKYNSIATAILGIIGGFITPFIISSSDNNVAGLLTYIVFLNLWIIGLAYKKPDWKAVEILGLFASYITYFSMQGWNNYTGNWMGSVLFLTVTWALYFGHDLSKIKRNIKEFTTEGNFLNIFNGVVFYTGIYYLFNNNNPNSTVFATFVIALVYLFSGISVYYKYNKLDSYLKQNFYAFAILFSIATNMVTSGFMKPIVFSIEAFWLLYVGRELDKSYMWKTSTALFSIAYVSLLSNSQTYSYSLIQNFVPILNMRTAAFLTTIGLSIGSVRMLAKLKNAEGLISYYRSAWSILLFVLLSIEINDFMAILAVNTTSDTTQMINFNKIMIQVITWLLYSTRLFSTGMKKDIKPFISLGLVGFSLAALNLFQNGTSFQPLSSYTPVFNLRFLTFVITAMDIMYLSNLLKQYEKKYDWCSSLQKFFSYAWGIILFLLVNFEVNDWSPNGDSTTHLIMSAAWLIYSVTTMYFGILKRMKPLRQISLGVLGLTVLKVFIYDLSFLDQLSRIASFMGLGIILLTLSFLYQKYSDQIKKLINEDITK